MAPAHLKALALLGLIFGPALCYADRPTCRVELDAPFNPPPADGTDPRLPVNIKSISIPREGEKKIEQVVLEGGPPSAQTFEGDNFRLQMFGPRAACVGAPAHFKVLGFGVSQQEIGIASSLRTAGGSDALGDPSLGVVTEDWGCGPDESDWARDFSFVPQREGWHEVRTNVVTTSANPSRSGHCEQRIFVARCINGEWQSGSRRFRITQAYEQVWSKQLGERGLRCGVSPDIEFRSRINLMPAVSNTFSGEIPVCNPKECVEAGLLEESTDQAKFTADIAEDANTIRFEIEIDAYKVERDAEGAVASCDRKKPETLTEIWHRVGPAPGLTGAMVPAPQEPPFELGAAYDGGESWWAGWEDRVGSCADRKVND